MSKNNQISASEKLERANAARLRKLVSTTVTVEVAEGKYKDFDKEAVLRTFSVMNVLDDETKFEVAYHVSYNDPVDTDRARAAVTRLGYQKNAHPDNLAMKEVFDAAMQMTLGDDKRCIEIIFNSAMFLKELEPEEHDMMRRGIFNRKDYLKAVGEEAVREARVAESIKSANKTPAKDPSAYKGGNEIIDRLLIVDKGTVLHPMLLDGFAEAGMSDPKNVEAYLAGSLNPTKGKAESKIRFMDFNQPGAQSKTGTAPPLTQSFAGQDRPKPVLTLVPPSPAPEPVKNTPEIIFAKVSRPDGDAMFITPEDIDMMNALAYEMETAAVPRAEP